MNKPGPLCAQCPYRDQPGPVWGVGRPDAHLAIVGMGPADSEITSGKPFSGASGRVLNGGLYRVGIDRERHFVTNIVKCYVQPGRPIDPEAARCCAPLLEREFDTLSQLRVTLALGQDAFHALTGKELSLMHNPKASKKNPNAWLRGAPYRATTESKRCIIGTWHPAGLIRGGFLQADFFQADLAKVARWAAGNGESWTESFNYTPSSRDVEDYCDYILDRGECGLDIETPERVLEEDEVVGREAIPIDVIGLSTKMGSAIGVPPDLYPILRQRLFIDSPTPLIVHAYNWGFDGYHLKTNQFNLSRVRPRDGMLILNLTYSDARPKDLATYLSIYTDLPYHKNLMASHPDIYNGRDTYGALVANQKAMQMIEFLNQTKLLANEHELIEVIEEWRTKGVNCDVAYAEKAELSCIKQLQAYEAFWNSKLPFLSWSSPKQLIEYFQGIGLPVQMKERQDGSKTPCADEEVLELYRDKHKNQVAGLVLEMRKLKKASDFTHFYSSDGRAHIQAKLHGQVAGRIQIKDPNLQTIPEKIAGITPRKIVIPDTPDDCLIVADYSQVELRVYARLAHDSAFELAFARGDYIYGQLYEEIFGELFFKEGMPRIKKNKHPDVHPWKLLVAKSGPLGLIYGRGVNSLMNLGVDRSKAQEIFNSFYREHPAIAAYHRTLERMVTAQGYLQSVFGRVRRFPNVKGQRNEWMSFPGQCTTSDILRQYAILPCKRTLPEFGARLLFTVHDSTIVNCPKRNRIACAEWMQQAFSSPVVELENLVIPIELGSGDNWYDTTSLEDYAHNQGATVDIQTSA